MIKFKVLKENFSQILAIIELNVKLRLKYKYGLLISFLIPITNIITSYIIMSRFFELNANFGPWTERTFIIFLFIGYNVFLLRRISQEIPHQFMQEKFWETIPSIIIAPFNRINWLFGIFISHMIIISIPFTIFFIICYVLYPISFLTLLFIFVLYFLIALIFSGIGFMIGIFAISNENIWKALDVLMILIIWLSCITYPFKIFPPIIQNIINLNPFYHMFHILRLLWIEDNIILTITSNVVALIILIICSIIFPGLGIYTFNIIYKKYGIVE